MYSIDVKEEKNAYIRDNKAEPITVIIDNAGRERSSLIYTEHRDFYYYKNIGQTIAIYISKHIFEKELLDKKYFGLRNGFDLKFIKRLNGTTITDQDRVINILLIILRELAGSEQNKSFEEFINKVVESVIFETKEEKCTE
jgi:hypothetical protein